MGVLIQYSKVHIFQFVADVVDSLLSGSRIAVSSASSDGKRNRLLAPDLTLAIPAHPEC